MTAVELAALLTAWAVWAVVLSFVTLRHDEVATTFARWVWLLSGAMVVAALIFPVFRFGGGGGTAMRDLLWWVRLAAGSALLAAVTNVVILARWYVKRPGIGRLALVELIRVTEVLAVTVVAILVVPPGMLAVITGAVDDEFGWILGWFWVMSVATLGILLVMVDRAIREPFDGAVMTVTGIMYLVVLCALGTVLVPRL